MTPKRPEEPAAKPRLPGIDEHSVVVGRNGTGKSQFGAWLLSTRDLKARPHFVIDYKGEDLFNSIGRAKHITHDDMPDDPGLYILHSRVDLATEMEDWLWRLLDRENAGLFVDEAYMLPSNQRKEGVGAFEGILTQGRSKHIPVITLSQRPVKVSRFVWSESKFVAVFGLNDKRDRKTLSELVPDDFLEWLPPQFEAVGRLPKYHARWYQSDDDARFVFAPVPSAKEIIAAIERQIEPPRKWI